MSFESGVFPDAGIGILVRNSTCLPPSVNFNSEASLVPDLHSDRVQSVDDRNWSWGSLRETFKTHGLGELYKRYVKRLQNAYFNVYLLLQIGISVIYLVTILIINQKNLEVVYPEVVAHVTIAFCSGLLLGASCDEKLFRSSPKAQICISVFIVVLIAGSDLALSLYFFINDAIIRTPSAFQTLIIIYFFLPLERKCYAVVLGVLVTLVHLLVYGIYFYSGTHDRLQRIVADCIFYICGNCVGIYSLFMNEVAVRRAFLDRRGYIQSTIKKDYETTQEEELLLSILPKHVSVQVKKELMEVFREIEEAKSSRHSTRGSNNNQHSSSVLQKKPFSQLFVERHNNVTILFADIVNFTPLTVTLSPEDLVETLNQLFGEFDEAAKRHDCLRIKLLGDCYYCVSGLVSNSFPFPKDAVHAKNHAKNCVFLGLEMIEIIRGVRERLQVNVQMRIGVHSGNIISGLLGIYKWQYDIWSKDVTIANRLESAGKPGKIHITRQTKDFLGDEFDYQAVTLRDKYLLENQIETYLIVPKRIKVDSIISEEDEELDPSSHNNIFTKSNRRDGDRAVTPRSSESRVRMTMKRSRMSMMEKRPTDVTGENINILIGMLGKVDDQMKDAIDKMPLLKIDHCCGNQNYGIRFNSIFMNYASWDFEKKYMTQPDPLFKFYIGCALFVLICMGIIQGVVMPSDHMILWIAFGIGGSYLLLIVPFVWVGYVWNRIKDPHQELDSIPDPKQRIIRHFYKTSDRIAKNWVCRTLIYLTVAVVLSTFAIIDVIECDNESLEWRILNQECQHPWYFTYCCTLAILGIYGFFRIHFMIKLVLCSISLSTYTATMFFFRTDVFDGVNVDDGSSPAIAPVYNHLVYLIKIILLLHIMDRQMEYINRLDFIWKLKLTEEHKAASITHATNAVLIHNILPVQIAKMYMDPTRMGQGYSRSYTDVAVMFASIPNFMDFYTETDLNDQGIKCLQLLNEIIVDFDNALFEFDDVEKIKVIGSTYMAACGLEVNERGRVSQSRYASAELGYMSNRISSVSSDSEPNMERRRKSLVTLVKFAAAMMVRLKGINKDAFQDFELRIGIDSGPIVAGVIGAQKPLYDIWGDCVNMASRMDSTGVNGKIQIAEKSANLLMQEGVRCVFRDRIRVKGKDSLIPAYFVLLNDRCDVQFGKRKFMYGNQLSVSASESEL